jgi:hypothetical protein
MRATAVALHRHASAFVFFSNWKSIMNSPSPIKMLNRVLALISAAILLQAHNVRAADFVIDAQTQARDLLSGTIDGRAKSFEKPPTIPADGHQTPRLDPQEQARRLILGRQNFSDAAAPFDSRSRATPANSARGKRRGYSDAQELARRMILGKMA